MANPSLASSAIAARSNTAPWTLSVGAAIICSVLIGQRFALTIGNLEVALCQFVVVAGLAALAVIGSLRVHLMRLFLFSMFLLGALWSPLINTDFSLPSFLNMLVIYGTFIFCTDADDRLHSHILDWIHRCVAIISVLAIVQLLMQLVGLPYFDFSLFVDSSLTVDGFNSFYAIYPGHWLNKSNGVFLLEPSFLGRFSAFALMLELLGKRRAWRLALYSASLLVSFSGTGLLLIAFAAIPVFMRLPGKHKVASLLIASGLFVWYFNTELGGSVVARLAEFTTRGASGSLRFTEPLEELVFLFDQEFRSFIVGHGPGTSVTELSTIVKAIYEYGLLGTVPYLLFISYCFFSDARSRIVSSALLFMHLVLSGSFLTPHTLYFYYAVLMFVPARGTAARGTTPLSTRRIRAKDIV